ncbi:hypothetical protein M758_UG066100 [Ceratodon purpureus]|nr:hypothetical protein M758_UG066100 [Ceratodon purpureus]
MEIIEISDAFGIAFPLTFEEFESVGSVHFSHTREVSTHTMSIAGWLRVIDEAYNVSKGARSRHSGQDQWCRGNASPQLSYSLFGSVLPSVDIGCSAVQPSPVRRTARCMAVSDHMWLFSMYNVHGRISLC